MANPLAMIALAEAHATASNGTLAMPAYKNDRLLGPVELQIERAADVGGATIYGVYLPGPGSALSVFQPGLGNGVATTLQTKIPYVALSNNNYIVRVSRSPRTGTVTVTAASTTVTGSGTAFTTELRIGDEIRVNGETRTVQSITSATVLVVDTAFVDAAAAVTISLIDGLLAPTTDFTVSDVGGFALITFGAAAKVPTGCKIEVFFVTPVALFTFATATLEFKRIELPRGVDVAWYLTDATATPSATNVYLRAIGQ